MTGCAGCGDCCERIHVNSGRGGLTAKLANPYIAGEARRDAVFIDNHMAPTGETDPGWKAPQVWACDRFDPVSRLCLAGDARPPMCSRYPWYEIPAAKRNEEAREKGWEDTAWAAEHVRWMGPRCSYLRDLPTPPGGWLTVGARPLIPLWPV